MCCKSDSSIVLAAVQALLQSDKNRGSRRVVDVGFLLHVVIFNNRPVIVIEAGQLSGRMVGHVLR